MGGAPPDWRRRWRWGSQLCDVLDNYFHLEWYLLGGRGPVSYGHMFMNMDYRVIFPLKNSEDT